jgi:hypothetical protein
MYHFYGKMKKKQRGRAGHAYGASTALGTNFTITLNYAWLL